MAKGANEAAHLVARGQLGHDGLELGLDDEKPSLDLLEAARHVAELPGHRQVQVADGAAELLLDTLKIASRGKAREVVLGCQAPKGVSEV